MTIGGLLPASLWIAVLATAAPAQSAQFYGWIDSSGTVVLTDNLNGLPSSMSRDSVWTYRFEDRREPAAPQLPQATDRQMTGDGNEPPQALDMVKAAPLAAPSSDANAELQEHMGYADDRVATGQGLILGVPLIGGSRPGQVIPPGLMAIPPGPGGLAQRLQELQTLQARGFSHPPTLQHHAGSTSVMAGHSQGHR